VVRESLRSERGATVNGPTHKLGAAAAAVLVAGYMGAPGVQAGVLAASAVAGCLLPDADGHYKRGFGGRSATHSVALGIVGTAALLTMVPYETLAGDLAPAARLLALGFAVGWLSHLVLDALTLERVPLLWPGVGPQIGIGLTSVERSATPTEWLLRAALLVTILYVVAATWLPEGLPAGMSALKGGS
jgi:membrane-bound metal-dependent hydrolase YbcI (DUF457 family)